MINFFKIYDNAIPEDFCDEVISFFEDNNDLVANGIVSGTESDPKKIKTEVKKTRELDISSLLLNDNLEQIKQIEKFEELFSKYSIESCNKYINNDNFIDDSINQNWSDIFEYLESRDSSFSNRNIKIKNFLPDIQKITTSGYRIKKYEKDDGYYNYHADPAWQEVGVSDNRWRVSPGQYLTDIRLLSVIMYLNTVDVGGETIFPLVPIKIKPIKGRVAVFPTHWTYLHKAETPVSNSKYSMNTFISVVI